MCIIVLDLFGSLYYYISAIYSADGTLSSKEQSMDILGLYLFFGQQLTTWQEQPLDVSLTVSEILAFQAE